MKRESKTVQVTTQSTSITVAGKRMIDELADETGEKKSVLLEEAVRLLIATRSKEAQCAETE